MKAINGYYVRQLTARGNRRWRAPEFRGWLVAGNRRFAIRIPNAKRVSSAPAP